METGQAGPPAGAGVSGRGLPRGVDGHTGSGTVPSAEGFAGAPGEARGCAGRSMGRSAGLVQTFRLSLGVC